MATVNRRQRRGLVFVVCLAMAGVAARAAALETTYCPESGPPSADTVVMLATSWCPYCAKARKFLKARGVGYCEYDVENSAVGAALQARAGHAGVPVIFIDGRVIGGFDQDELSLALKQRARRKPAPDRT